MNELPLNWALTPDQLAALHKQSGLPEIPAGKPKKERPEDRLKQDIVHLLTGELRNLQMSLQTTEAALNNMRKPDYRRLHMPGVARPTFDKKEIVKAEDELLGFKMRQQALDEALEAVKNGQPMPPDFGATLKILEKETKDGQHKKKLHALYVLVSQGGI